MVKKRTKLLALLLSLVMVFALLPMSVLADGEPDPKVAKTGDVEYSTFDAAMDAAKDGDTITLLADCEVTHMPDKSLTINGTGKLSANNQTWNSYQKVLTLDGSGVSFVWRGSNNDWLLLSLSGTLNVINGAKIAFFFDSDAVATTAVYMGGKATINVNNRSTFEIHAVNTLGKIGQGIQCDAADSAAINVSDNSEFLIDGTNRGYVNSPIITVTDSAFTIENCTANASNGGNFTAKKSNIKFINNSGHGLSVGTLNITGSTVTAENNGYNGIAARNTTIDGSSTVNVTDNGAKLPNSGAFRVLCSSNLNVKSTCAIDDGANVNIVNNYCSGIIIDNTNGSMTMNSGVVTGNGSKATNGGGVNNKGTFTMGKGVQICNNHAAAAGDDVYNAAGATTTLADTGSWTLAEDNTPITAWFYDGAGDGINATRWNASADPTVRYTVQPKSLEFTEVTALKAAHPYYAPVIIVPVPPVTPPAPTENIPDEDVPLADLPTDLNSTDHFAYIKGYPDGTVQPNGNITRAEVTTAFYRLLTAARRDAIFTSDKADYTDVAAGQWFNKAAASMSAGGYVMGYPDGTFGANKSITRAEFVAIAARFMAAKAGDVTFTDVSADSWAYKYISTAVAYGWIDGYPDGSFKPNQPITRAEAMKVINTMLGRGVDAAGLLDGAKVWPDNSSSAWYYFEVMEATNDHLYTGARPAETWTSLTIDYTYDIAKYERP